VDPRPSVIGRRLGGIGRILAITGGKGGIGKSSVATGLALALARAGTRVGLLDLDLCGPSDHVILGIRRPTFSEDSGLVPMTAHGVVFMSITGIVGDDPAPLRGDDVTNAILELLAVTNWGELDVLVVDMPPGFGDTLLDAARYLPRAAYVVVATPSDLVLETTRKTIDLLGRLDLPIVGIVENLRRDGQATVRDRLGPTAPPLLGSVEDDPDYEAALGDPERLAATGFGRSMARVAARIRDGAPPA
jgi:ATP-binding protein involved in chromosome partitioning